MESRELLEEREARLRLYFRLLADLGTGRAEGNPAREVVLALVRREIGEISRFAERRLRALKTEDEREAFRYAVSMALPYYTHLARLYAGAARGRCAGMRRRTHAVS